MVENLSFNFDGNKKVNTQRKASTAQINFYTDLCIQRGVVPKDTSKMLYNELDLEIKTLRNTYPASDNQKTKIVELIVQLNEIGINVKTLDEKELNKLTGGHNGTASILIESLIKLLSENTDKMKPTNKQLETIVSWFYCPDIPFEDYNVSRKVPVKHLESYSSDLPYEEQDTRLWRKPTPQEFASLIIDKFNKADASQFIDKYRGAFYAWKQTRCTAQQKNFIRELEARLCDTSTQKEITFSIDASGNIQQIKTNKAQHNYNPQGYQPLSDADLCMMSINDASQYIDLLNNELKDKSLYQYNESPDERLETTRQAKNKKDAEITEFNNLNDLMYAFEALAGYDDEELHECATELVCNKDITDNNTQKKRSYIYNFMMQLLENNCIDIAGLTQMCEKSTTAQKILLHLDLNTKKVQTA